MLKIKAFSLVFCTNFVQLCRTILIDMAFTIRTVCREYSRLKKESALDTTLIELNLAVYKNGKTSFKSYKIKGKLELQHWDQDRGIVKKGCVHVDELNQLIKSTINVYDQVGLEWELQKRSFTAQDLINYDKESSCKEQAKGSLMAFFDRIIRSEKLKGTGNFKTYETLKADLHRFIEGKDLSIRNVNQDFINKYCDWCTRKGNKKASIKAKIAKLKALVERAGKQGIKVARDISFKTAPIVTAKRGLSEAELHQLLNYKPTKCNQEFAMDMFLFTYCTAGINFKDLAYLTEENIIDGNLSYVRRKTNRPIFIPLVERAIQIIEKYKRRNTGSKYIFPVIPKEMENLGYVELYDHIRNKLQNLNYNLKVIGKQLKLPMPLTTYVARHSYATQLLRKEVSLAMISKALGHSSLAMTSNYLNLDGYNLRETFQHLGVS